MTLYETIFSRRQVRNYLSTPIDSKTQEDILDFARKAEQLDGETVQLQIVPADQVSGGQGASCYLLAYCEQNAAPYANVGFVLQKVDLYVQSMGLGCGWFMSVKPKESNNNFCIALAIGRTEQPMRKSAEEFKRKAPEEICSEQNAVTQAVRLAPSSLNSQPWTLKFEPSKITVEDSGRGVKRIILKNKLNKIDVGIAARHAVIALEKEGASVKSVAAEDGKNFKILISYKQEGIR